jgi:hypothetical protein
MASELRSKELAYGGHAYEHGTYSFLKVMPESNASSITITAGGGSDLILMIPSRTALSLSKSILDFISTPVAAGSATFNWQWVHTVPFFQRVSVYTTSGRMLMDSDNMANRIAIELPAKTPLQKLLVNDTPSGGTGVWEGLSIINSAIASTATSAFVAPGLYSDGVSMAKSYTQIRQIVVGGSNTATPVVHWQIPMSIFGDILEDPRILAFNEGIYIKFQMSPIQKCYFASASATDPTSSAAAGTSITLSGITLNLAVVQDPKIAQETLAAIASSGGLNLMIDFTNSLKLSTTGTSQNFSNVITRAFGGLIKAVTTSVFSQPETLNTAYGRNNIAQAIWTQLQTYANSVPLQISPMIASNYDDYKNLQKYIQGTSIQSSSEFNHENFWIDYFYNKNDIEQDPTAIAGMVIDRDIIYMAQLNAVSATNMIYVFQKYQRRLTIDNRGTFLDGN